MRKEIILQGLKYLTVIVLAAAVAYSFTGCKCTMENKVKVDCHPHWSKDLDVDCSLVKTNTVSCQSAKCLFKLAGDTVRPDVALNVDTTYTQVRFLGFYQIVHGVPELATTGHTAPELEPQLEATYPISGGKWRAFSADSSIAVPDTVEGGYALFEFVLAEGPLEPWNFPDSIVEASTGRWDSDSSWEDPLCDSSALAYPECMIGTGVCVLPDCQSLDTCVNRGSELDLGFSLLNTTETADSFNVSVYLETDAEGNIWEWSSLGLFHLDGYGDTVLTFNVTLPETIYGGQRAYVRGVVKGLSGDEIDANTVQFDICVGVGVEEETEGTVPKAFSLQQNYPNPFNPVTEIRYALPRDCWVKLEVYNILGEKVATLVDGQQKAGYRSAHWSADKACSGIYFYRLQAGDYTDTKKMVILK